MATPHIDEEDLLDNISRAPFHTSNGPFAKEWESILRLYKKANRPTECIVASKSLIEYRFLPRYFRIAALAMLATLLPDWTEAEACYRKAEDLWREQYASHIARKEHSIPTDVKQEEAMQELREYLDGAWGRLEGVMVEPVGRPQFQMYSMEVERAWRLTATHHL